eukprot:TRINITY_DN6953_c0_g1_i2.p1 TRINITY_DN6953_c0_g1~~TRINITY_DN6953_c0_g1_i2.p1  ORF type:complete len:931 (-),score=242.79 TRINITY_DN6953_c0_g1_i2:19-2499(-)
MTHPTKAICPVLLEDYRKITVERKGETNFFTNQMIKDCMKKVTAVNIHQTIHVDDELEIKPYYAGHVLGAAMFYVKVGGLLSVLYTGDFNMTPDRHLGSAAVDEKLRPDLLITETTYATLIRDSKRMREGNFLKRIHKSVSQGGKVLIPVFALGRAQELCILIETYWERMGLTVPIYFSAGMTEKANMYYELFINWTNEKIKTTFVHRNMFDFKHIKPFLDKTLIDKPGAMVLFATPGMLHAGTSLEAFKKWCHDEVNMCILPGYCTAGTVGHKVLSGRKFIELDKQNKLDVRCQVESLSFSAHADSKGIMQLIQQVQPKNVMLVHGEKQKMSILKKNIVSEFGIPCFDPANGQRVNINNSEPSIPADLSIKLLQNQFYRNSSNNDGVVDDDAVEWKSKRDEKKKKIESLQALDGMDVVEGNRDKQEKTTTTKITTTSSPSSLLTSKNIEVQAAVVISTDSTEHGNKLNTTVQVLDPSQVVGQLGLHEHKLRFESSFPIIIPPTTIKSFPIIQGLFEQIKSFITSAIGIKSYEKDVIRLNHHRFSEDQLNFEFELNFNSLTIKHVSTQKMDDSFGFLEFSWDLEDDELSSAIFDHLEQIIPQAPKIPTEPSAPDNNNKIKEKYLNNIIKNASNDNNNNNIDESADEPSNITTSDIKVKSEYNDNDNNNNNSTPNTPKEKGKKKKKATPSKSKKKTSDDKSNKNNNNNITKNLKPDNDTLVIPSITSLDPLPTTILTPSLETIPPLIPYQSIDAIPVLPMPSSFFGPTIVPLPVDAPPMTQIIISQDLDHDDMNVVKEESKDKDSSDDIVDEDSGDNDNNKMDTGEK